MSTLEICDRVMVIVDGRMAGFDTKPRCSATTPITARASQLATAGAGEAPAAAPAPAPVPVEPQR